MTRTRLFACTSSAVMASLLLFAVTPVSRADNEGSDEENPPSSLERINVIRQRERPGVIWSLGPNFDFRNLVSPPPTFSYTAPEQETDERTDDCNEGQPGRQSAGNPVVLYTGNKVEPETDFQAAGEMGLFLRRVYNHHWSAAGIFGNHWLSNFDYSLVFTQGQDIAWAQRPDGSRVKFLHDVATSRWYEDRAQPVAYIIRRADGQIELHADDRSVEIYNAEGFITQRKNEQGVKWDFVYANRYLQKVTHSSGRTVQFTWTNGQLTQVTDPAGAVYRYAYTSNALASGRGRLATTTLPGTPATTIQYHYEDARYPGGLTGKSFNGVRYSSFAYDGQRRAISTQHAGGIERYQFSYAVQATEPVLPPPPPIYPGGQQPSDVLYICGDMQFSALLCMANGNAVANGASAGGSTIHLSTATGGTRARPVKSSVTVTNPLGRKTTYTYEDGKAVSVAGDPSPRCAASYKEMTYDANGYPKLVFDFQDVATLFDYDAYGRLLKKVEASGTTSERTTRLVWNDQHRLVKEILEGVKEVQYTYDTRGNISSTTERNLGSHGTPNQSRTINVAYTYHGNGLKASVKIDGPLANDDVTYAFNAQGNLISTTNGLGHKTTYADHTGLGVPRRVTGANGDVQELTFDARGRPVQSRSSVGSGWATTSYTYDAAGNVASLTEPQGITTRNDYDAGRRLLRQSRPIAGGAYQWTNLTYDAASNVVRREIRQTDYPSDSAVTGYLDALTHDGQWNWYLSGWACSTGSRSSIEVHAYADNVALLGTAIANQASDASIANACQTTATQYRYRIPLTLANRQQHGGRLVFAHGQSPKGAAYNQQLANSGAFTIPRAGVKGEITGVSSDGNWKYAVDGWACSVGMNQSIAVEAYAGGPPGQGVHLVSGWANRASDGAISNACETSASAYRFSLPLGEAQRRTHGNRPIHVQGISPVGGTNGSLGRSGSVAVPPMTFASSAVEFRTPDAAINSGDSVAITITFRNTGNVIWRPGEVVLRWGDGWMHSERPLASAVPPGANATFTIQVTPVHLQEGMADVVYYAQMSSGGAAFGAQSSGVVSVYRLPLCNPVCEISLLGNEARTDYLAGGAL